MGFTEGLTDNLKSLHVLDTYLVGHKGFIAGGCFKNIFNKEKVKDIDMFFNNLSDWDNAVKHFKNSEKFTFYYENAKVKAYKHNDTKVVVECIRSTFGTQQEILSNFDFTIAKFAYWNEKETGESNNERITGECIYHEKYFEHLFFKRIVTDDKIPFPVSTFQRMIRYIRYGYMPCRETKVKIIEAIKKSQLSEDISSSLYDGLD